ncbi:organic solvent tolerance protein OstA [Niastella vici]|uniref:Organic solvent tolerance protein OstA n=1 Tax=Niastella vici TaxID=1703345 RepID=A0A1V9FQ50_9BACT|nr:putative LPS assembly protein LptD [Niastella vici]OQP60484.1 organic solvent tolerance protein OstA [Niastella vici]
MMNGRKNNLKDGSALILSLWLLLLTSDLWANYFSSPHFDNSLTWIAQDTTKPVRALDTIPKAPKRPDSVPGKDTLINKTDTVVNKTDTVNVAVSADSLDAPVAYKASDSMVLNVPDKKIILYSKANVKYKDMDLSADSIELDQGTQMVTATFRKDTAGKMIGRPVMVQADSKMSSDVIKYNFKSQRGITENTMTMQGEMLVLGEKVKKINDKDYFAYRSQFTTCNLDTPHFAFRANKMKMVSQKLAVSGPIHPEFEGVPVPIYIPFGFFPLSQGRHSGILPPQFSQSEQFGLGLEGLGYYKVLNEYFDVTMRTNLYSYGGYSLFLTPTYRVRYRYNGAMNLSYQSSRILSNSAKQEFTNTKTYSINWNHTVDSRARPGTSFSANVNIASTKYNQLIPNNPTLNFTNTLSSSIAYSKTWGTKYNLTATANHNQNNQTQVINLNLPNLSFTVNTLYPLQPKEYAGVSKWYHKLGVGLNSTVSNQASFLEKNFSLMKIIDTMQWGAQHSIPIQLSLPQLGPFQISPGISYSEKWYSQKLTRTWDTVNYKLDTTIQKGLYRSNDVSFSLGLNTAMYGMFDKFGKKSPIAAIRHVIRPNLSFSYKPDLGAKYHYNVQVDTAYGKTPGNGHFQRFSYFDGSIYGAPSEGVFGGIGFGIDNNIEAKVRSKKDTANGGIKKIKLIDGFGFTSSYNFIADSFKLSPFSLYVRSTLFEKINITAGATMDPYQVDSFGYRIDKYMWQKKGFSLRNLGRITSGNIAISTSFQSQKGKDKKAAQQKEQALKDQGGILTAEEQQAQLAYTRANPAEFADFNVPWSLSLSYSMSFSRAFRSDYSGWQTTTYSSMSWNGDFNLTPKWKFGMNGYYDIKASKIQTFTMYISREMHCWQLSINVTPVGLYRTFNFTISPKSGILRDLRINRTRYFYQ